MSYLFREAELNENRETRVAIQKVYGVSWRKAILVASKVGLSFPLYLHQINKYNFKFLSAVLKLGIISDARIERREVFDCARLIGINSVKGLRHKLCLPVHGQRTHTNASTQRLKRGARVKTLPKARVAASAKSKGKKRK